MDKAARAALLTAKGIKSNRSAYALGGSEDGIDVYHASPTGIVGKFKPSTNDVGIHFAANPDLAHNAAVKSAYHKPRNAENIAVQKFRINAKPEQIVDIPAQGNRFDFYDILEHLHGIGRMDEGTFNKTYDKLQEIEDRDMTYERMNPVFSRALAKSNIKALRYMNNFDAGPTWKDMNEGRMTSTVTPDYSYMVTDPSAIEYPEGHKAYGGAIGKSAGGAMDSKSENIADYVADLLRQGRAKEVTDDLMAQADPQRLYQHYTSGNTGQPMPMDYASRMARAKGMGFSHARRSQSTETPFNDVPWAQFSHIKNGDVEGAMERLQHYGQGQWLGKPSLNGVDAAKQMVRAGRESKPFHGLTGAEVARQAFPQDIVEGAGLWDDPDTAKHVTDEIVNTGGKSIQTPDGMVAFGKDDQPHPTDNSVRSYDARFDPRLDHLAHLSASAGGAMDFARHVEAVHRAGGQIAPSKYLPNVPRQVHADGGKVDFVKDNPGGDWLANKQSYAFEYPRMKGIDGAITGWMGGKSDLFLPTHVLKSIEPLNNEKRVAGEPRFDDLMSSVSKEGFDPHQKGNKVVVAVNHRGKPFILEGNTRVAVAHAMGVPSVKAEVRYWNGAEEADGPMHPDKVLAMASNDPDITKAEGGRIHANGGGKMDLRSRAANVVSGLQQKRGNVDELLSMLANGKVKAAELANAGRPFGHSVSKDELAEHFRNAVPQVGVEKLGGMDSNQYTRFDDYFLPGAKNYREHLLTLQNREGHTPFVYPWHWGDRKNILAHVRMADRDNGDTLHVGEVQSDWGQHARQRGYYDPTKPFRVYNKDTHETKKLASNQFEARDEAIKSGPRYGVEPSINYYPPAGPYIGDTQQWTDLALKHILTEAAKNGHKRIVFSPGEHSADMYKQRWKIDSFRLHRNPEGSDTLGTLAPYDKDGFLTASGFTPVKDEKDLADQIGEEHAAKLLASPLKSLPRSNMLVDQWQKGDPAPEPTHTLTEPDMHIGGQGMIKYYKRNVNAGVLKLLRQHDPSIQPESYDLPSDPEAGNHEGYKGFAVPMTDTARQSILKNGFEAYKDGGTVDDNDPAPVIQNPMSIFPKPQRMFPEDQRPKGGQYISTHNKADVTGHKAEAATIGIGPNGKPFFHASQNAVDQTGTAGRGSATTKTNLFKQKAGWKWQDAPEGHENTETIVSVEHRGKHFYALNAHFPKGVDLARYENATSEPRLRPTTQGNVTLGPQAGSISVRGKMHPVYHHIIVKADGGTVDDALALTRRFTKDGIGATVALKSKGK